MPFSTKKCESGKCIAYLLQILDNAILGDDIGPRDPDAVDEYVAPLSSNTQ